MIYSKEFKEYISKCLDLNFYAGTGNPMSKILFIGKESNLYKENQSILPDWYRNNAKNWFEHIKDSTCESLEYTIDESHPLRSSWGKNTWSKYQMLFNHINENVSYQFEINFLKSIFTSEINDSPNKNTKNADKTTLNDRKELFKNSSFIQSFPIIVLGCSDYISNHGEAKEINETFNVEFVDSKESLNHFSIIKGYEVGIKSYSRGNWFSIHLSTIPDNPKLVIHTRQLSANVNNDLLKDIATTIKEFLILNNIALNDTKTRS